MFCIHLCACLSRKIWRIWKTKAIHVCDAAKSAIAVACDVANKIVNNSGFGETCDLTAEISVVLQTCDVANTVINSGFGETSDLTAEISVDLPI